MSAMPMTRNAAASIVLLILSGAVAAPALADDECAGFKWDVSKERALFAGAAADVIAGHDPKSAPVVVPNRLYRVRLAPQTQVTLARAAVKEGVAYTAPADAAYAGIATLKISAGGSYRVAIDGPYWIDVLSNGALIAAKDFQGQHGCQAPRKIVEFELSGAQRFVLQLSDARENVRLTITRSPARKL
jgi:hypothetical protein